MQFNPVRILTVFVPDRGNGGGADLVDHQCSGFDEGGSAEGSKALLRVLVSGGVLLGDDVVVATDPAIAHVVIHRRDGQFLKGDAVAAEEEERIAAGGELELGVQRLACGVLVFVGGKDDDAFAGRKRNVREDECDLVRAVAQAVALERNDMVAGVGQLNPVWEGTGLVGKRRAVGGHGLRNAKSAIARGHICREHLGAGDIGGGRKTHSRSENDQHDHQCDQAEQERQRSLARLHAPQRTAFSLWWAGFSGPIGAHGRLPFKIRQIAGIIIA